MAIVGWFSGLDAFVCGMRAAAGAAGMFVLVRFAGKAVLSILVDAALKGRARESERQDW